MSVIIETSIGDVTVDLFTEERPRCCLNFLKLCKIKYYNFSLFHTVQPNVVAQTGDPTATGRGGESIFGKLYGEQARFFDMEVIPQIKHYKKGLISMVNNGSGMHGSQFFFTLADNLDYLDGKHTVFGEVAEGFEILDKFNNTFCGEDNRPHQDIRIYHTIILDDPFDDPDNLDIPSMSPGPTEEMLNSDHIPCDANIDEDKDKTQEELREMMAEKEAKANTQILEMVGDLPAADVAPPENVLFVCKLNPVTTAEDLEIIFSRFGPIVSCEVIKDSKTGESLQYAFIEFECEEHCESAYFKMDNVLIDDRRIHVDFSQSVSKLKWKGKGKGVDILETGDAPVYVLKNQQRKNDGYELVYEDEPGDKTKAKVEKKKKKRSTRSESEEDREKYNKKEKKRPRSHSASPDVRKRTEVNQSYSRNEDRRRDEYRDRRKEESERGRENTRRQEEDNERREWNGKRSREDDSRRRDERSSRREEYERIPRRNDDREKEREKNKRGRDDRDDNRYNNKSRQDRSKYDRRNDSSDEEAIRGYSSKKSNSNDDIYSRNTSHSKSQQARSKYDKGNSAGQEQTREGYSSKRGNSEDSDTVQQKRSKKKKKDKNKRQTVESNDSESSESNSRKKKSESASKKKKKSKKSHKSRRQSTSSSED